ncbi:LCP family protein [Chloroflexota bacterium]
MSNNQSTQKTQPTRTVSWASPPPPNRRRQGYFLLVFLIPLLLIGIAGMILFLGGGRTNILVLGLDSRESGSDLGRSDTMILSTFVPREPYFGMLSIPRDLWVSIPDYGENRINTAHYFAEADSPGSGPQAAMITVSQNFGVDVDYYIRIRFGDFLDLVDLIGGVEIDLPVGMSGYVAGTHYLNGEQALVFVRDRSGSDDFYRMQRSQIFLKGLWKRMLDPIILQQFPDILPLVFDMVDTNIPLTKWIYIGITMFRVGQDGIDARLVTRDLTNPFTTSEGAQVLGPDWPLIQPILQEMFEQ